MGMLKLISFVGAAMVLGLERRVSLGEPYAGPGGAPKQDLTIEGVNADDARAILAALDKGVAAPPAAAPEASPAPAPVPAPEKPKPAEPTVVPAAQPESRRRRAAAPPPVPPPPPPPEEDDEDDEEEDEDVDNDEEDDEEDQAVSAPPPIPDELKAPAVPMKKFVVHFQSLGLKTEAQMQAALVALVPQCPALQKIGEAPDILRRLQQTRTVLGIKD